MLEGAGYKLMAADYLAMADAAEGQIDQKTLNVFRGIVERVIAPHKSFKSKRERQFFGMLARRIEKAAAEAKVEEVMGDNIDDLIRMASGGRMFQAADKQITEVAAMHIGDRVLFDGLTGPLSFIYDIAAKPKYKDKVKVSQTPTGVVAVALGDNKILIPFTQDVLSVGFSSITGYHFPAMAEDSPLEGPVGGFNRHAKIMSPDTRDLVLKSREQEIMAFAEDRGLNPTVVYGLAEAALRMGKVPDTRMYGIIGDEAKAIKDFLSHEILNLGEDEQILALVDLAISEDAMSAKLRKGLIIGARAAASDAQGKPAGYSKAINALKQRKFSVLKSLVHDTATAKGAGMAFYDALMASGLGSGIGESGGVESEDLGEDLNEAISAGMGAYMQIGSAFMRRPKTLVDVSQWEKTAKEDIAEPRVGVDAITKPAPTLEDIFAVDEAWKPTQKNFPMKTARNATERWIFAVLSPHANKPIYIGKVAAWVQDKYGAYPKSDRKSVFKAIKAIAKRGELDLKGDIVTFHEWTDDDASEGLDEMTRKEASKKRKAAWAKMSPEEKKKYTGDSPVFMPELKDEQGPPPGAPGIRRKLGQCPVAKMLKKIRSQNDAEVAEDATETDDLREGSMGYKRIRRAVKALKKSGDQERYFGHVEPRQAYKIQQSQARKRARPACPSGQKMVFGKCQKVGMHPGVRSEEVSAALLREKTGEKWIQKAIEKPGALRKEIPERTKKGTIPVKELQKAAKEPGVTGKRARLALTLRKFRESE